MKWCSPTSLSPLKFGLWALASLSVLFLTACSSTHSRSLHSRTSPSLVWPAPPEPARIAYVSTLSSPADFGARSSVFIRLGKWLTGSGKSTDVLRKPFGIALDENENLCLTDTGANVVCFYDRNARKWRRWDKIGQVRFLCPVAVAKHNGTFFVADSTLGKVVAFNEAGKLQFQITNHLERPCAVAIAAERLFVADSQRHRVCVFGLDGAFRKQFGTRGSGKGQFNFPTHLAIGQSTSVYVTDSMNSRVQIFSLEGEYKSEIGTLGDSPGNFGRPKGIAVDSEGRVHVLDAAFDNLQIFDNEGRLLLTVGENGAEPGQFWLPNGIAIARSGEIFVADSYNRRVQEFKYVGQ